MKKILTNRILWIVIASIVVLAVIFFPHTKKTKVNGELTGYFVTIEERYLLHNRVELTRTNVCVDTVVERVHETDYKLNGDIKRVFVEYCDGSTSETKYSDNRYIQSIEELDFVGNSLESRSRTYNDFGLITRDEQIEQGSVVLREYGYDINNVIHTFKSIMRQLEQITYTREDIYEDGNLVSMEVSEFENNQLISKVTQEFLDGELQHKEVTIFENGAETESLIKVQGQTMMTILYSNVENNEQFTAICEDGNCIVDSYETDQFEVKYLADESRFVVIDKEDDSELLAMYGEFTFTMNEDALEFIEELREYLTEVLND